MGSLRKFLRGLTLVGIVGLGACTKPQEDLGPQYSPLEAFEGVTGSELLLPEGFLEKDENKEMIVEMTAAVLLEEQQTSASIPVRLRVAAPCATLARHQANPVAAMDREHFCKGKDRAFPGEEASAAGYYWHGRREAVMNGRLGNDLPKAFSTALHERGHGAYALGASQLPLESCGETRYVGEDYSRFVWRCFREGAIDMLALESRDHDFTVTRERAFLPEGGEISLDRVATEDTIMCKLSLIENAGYSPEGFVEYLRMNDGHLQCRERTAARGCEDRQLARLQAFIDSHPRSAHAHQARLDRADILWRLTVHDAYRNELGRVPSGTPFPATARELTALLDMPMIELNRGVFVPRSLSAALESLQKDSLGESVPGRAYLWWDVAEGCVASPSECAALEKGLDRYWRKRDALRERLFEEPPYRRWLGRLVAQNS